MQSWWKKGWIVAAAILFIAVISYKLYGSKTSQAWHLPLSGKVIVLDPGHGGPDGGASGKGSVHEKDVALDITKNLKDYLQQSGALVMMTRETDRDLANEDTRRLRQRKTEDLHRRAAFVEEADPDLLVSIHLNAIPSPRWRGAQTFFYPRFEESERLAKFIQDSLRDHLNNTDRFAKTIGHVYLLKSVHVPSALVEAGFLSNPTEKELLASRPYQKKIAASVYQGILRYYTNERAPDSSEKD